MIRSVCGGVLPGPSSANGLRFVECMREVEVPHGLAFVSV